MEQNLAKNHDHLYRFTTFSADGSQVISAMYWYKPTVLQRVYHTDTGNQVDSFGSPRPRADAPLETTTSAASCTAWRGAQTPITSLRHTVATTRVCTTGSQTLTKTTTATTPRTKATASSTPSPPTGHSGTTPTPTAMGITLLQPTRTHSCRATPGASTEDRFGCPDTDGDSWSDASDWDPLNPDQWVDADEDEYGDNYGDLDEYQYPVNQTGGNTYNDSTRWNDTDGDGYGDEYENASWNTYRPPTWPGLLLPAATCPMPSLRGEPSTLTPTGIGLETIKTATDPMPVPISGAIHNTTVSVAQIATVMDIPIPRPTGPSTPDYYGADAFPDDPTQWCDEDGDGFGSNPDGNQPDDCPQQRRFLHRRSRRVRRP